LTNGNIAVGVGFVWHKATPSGTAGITAIKNTNGVVIEPKSMTPGASLKAAAQGARLSVSR
jgi:hypothetical protein